MPEMLPPSLCAQKSEAEREGAPCFTNKGGEKEQIKSFLLSLIHYTTISPAVNKKTA
jgi:hypothetical protein